MRELQRDELPALQALFDANPDYFVLVSGKPPRPDEAALEYEELPPPQLGFSTRWFAGVFDLEFVLCGLVILVSDLAAPGVWHTALFFLANSVRRKGVGTELHQAIEHHARASGARWLRLGVVVGNVAAEQFWIKCGYQQVRTRSITNASGEVKLTRVMVKSLFGEAIARYTELVPRDAPDSSLP